MEGDGGKRASGGGEKTFKTYIDKMQATVAEWVYLRSIFEVCLKDTGYEGVGEAPEVVVAAGGI